MKRGVNTFDEILEKFFGKLDLGYYLCVIMENKITTVCNVEGSFETLSYLNSLLEGEKFINLVDGAPDMEDFEIEEVELVCKSLDEFMQVIIHFKSDMVPPLKVIEYLFNHLSKETKDDDLSLEGDYYNEDYSEIGIFVVSNDEGIFFEDGYPMMSEEEYMEEYDDEFYFETEVKPALEDLRKSIGISVYCYWFQPPYPK